MSDKVKALSGSVLKSFADLDKKAFQPPPPQWVKWDHTAQRIQIMTKATQTLSSWLDARLADLVTERIPLESVTVHHNGARTIIYVGGVTRFEFKLKVIMEGR